MKTILCILTTGIWLCGRLHAGNIPTAQAETFFHQVQWTNLVKSPFESAAEYTNRIKSECDLEGKKVWIEVSGSAAFFTYNAEDKQAAIGLRGYDGVFPVCVSNLPSYRDMRQNTYGAQAEVTHEWRKSADFRFANLASLPGIVSDPAFTIPLRLIFPLAAQRANDKTSKNELKLLICVEIGNMAEAKITNVLGLQATIASPVSSGSTHYQIPAKLIGMRVVDKTSDSVLAEWRSAGIDSP